jgi:hypothetical protein
MRSDDPEIGKSHVLAEVDVQGCARTALVSRSTSVMMPDAGALRAPRTHSTYAVTDKRRLASSVLDQAGDFTGSFTGTGGETQVPWDMLRSEVALTAGDVRRRVLPDGQVGPTVTGPSSRHRRLTAGR